MTSQGSVGAGTITDGTCQFVTSRLTICSSQKSFAMFPAP